MTDRRELYVSLRPPYVGPRPFARDDAPLFYGRDLEANELLSLIIAHPVLLLYAQSGAGKTSLLNARVTPMLEERGSEVFGGVRVGGELPQGVDGADVTNIFVFNALMTLQSEAPSDPAALGKMSLADYLKTKSHLSHSKGVPAPRVIIFDQFEEIFTYFADRWTDRESFFDSVGEALEQDRRLRVVFAMREEYIASMDPYVDVLPEQLRTRYRLERLREEPALMAVEKPLKHLRKEAMLLALQSPLAVNNPQLVLDAFEKLKKEKLRFTLQMPLGHTRRVFAPGAAKQLVTNLLQVPIKSATGNIDVSGEFIEPVQLQIVCQNLWESLPSDVTVIDEQYIKNYGDVDVALSTYYEDCVRKVVSENKVREGDLRRWFEKKLITPDGLRGNVYKDKTTTGGLPNEVATRLENLHLVRPEIRGGAFWYELTHDRFIVPILKSNQEWRASFNKGTIIAADLDQRADKWLQSRQQKPGEGLLSGRELKEVQAWMASPEAEAMGVSSSLREYVTASKLAQQSETARELRKRVTILVVVLIVALISVAVAFISFLYALQKRRVAEEAVLKVNGKVASNFAKQRGKEFDALSFGLQAVDVKPGVEPPAEAVQGLKDAIAAVGNTLWLRRNSTATITQIYFSADGKSALTTSKDEVSVWDATTGARVFHKDSEQGYAWQYCLLSPDGKYLFCSREKEEEKSSKTTPDSQPSNSPKKEESLAGFWDVETEQPVEQLQAYLKGAQTVKFSRDSKSLVAYGADNLIYFLKINDKQPPVIFHDGRKTVKAVFISPTGTRVLSIDDDEDGTVQLWETQTGKPLGSPHKIGDIHPRGVRGGFSPDGNRYLLLNPYSSSSVEKSPIVWNAQTGERITTIQINPSERAFYLAFSPDGNRVTFSQARSYDYFLKTYDTTTGQSLDEEYPLKVHIEYQKYLSYNQGLILIAIVVDSKSSIQTINLLGKEVRTLMEFPYPLKMAEAPLDQSRLLTVDENDLVQIWKLNEPPPDVDHLSLQDLRLEACQRLRGLEEYKDVHEKYCHRPDKEQ